jgi:hypothetical protein
MNMLAGYGIPKCSECGGKDAPIWNGKHLAGSCRKPPTSVYAISRWNNPHRNRLLHIDAKGAPLCGIKQCVLSWEPTEEAPTCKKCLKLWD